MSAVINADGKYICRRYARFKSRLAFCLPARVDQFRCVRPNAKIVDSDIVSACDFRLPHPKRPTEQGFVPSAMRDAVAEKSYTYLNHDPPFVLIETLRVLTVTIK